MRTTTLSSHVTWYKIGSYTPSKKYSKDKHLGPKYPKVFKEKKKKPGRTLVWKLIFDYVFQISPIMLYKTSLADCEMQIVGSSPIKTPLRDL